MDWAGIAGDLLSALALGGAGWVAKSIRDLRREIAEAREAADARQDGIEARLVKCEELSRHDVIKRLGECERQISSLATVDQVGRIHARIDDLRDDDAKLAAEIGEVKGLVQAQSAQLQIIQQHLIERRD